MTQTVGQKLKALRERAGIGTREMARRLGMSTSTYVHYENRIKREFLPMGIALSVAGILDGPLVTRAEVLALAQPADMSPPEPFTPAGFSEDASIYLFREKAVPTGAEHLTLRAVFGDKAAQPVTFRLDCDLPGLAIRRGDVIVADLRAPPVVGELGIVSVNQNRYLVRRRLDPWLIAGDASLDESPLRIDDPGVSLRFRVIGTIRGVDPED